ncbi:hypothetical protein [Taibaiella chishuiensis]|uniref:hypothetical protein n=1 Tax=Taibaiella chishuiensis TaxID=1434707 RepID=UPI0011B1E219|nr:hypothetical protein [Taibaiella chishuiensis]
MPVIHRQAIYYRVLTWLTGILLWYCPLLPAYAQTVLRLEHIDRISYQPGSGTLSFYEQQDTLYRQVFPVLGNVIENGSTLPRKTGAWQWSQDLFHPGDSIVDINQLEAVSAAALFRHLQYRYRVTETRNGDTAYSILGLFNPGKALIQDIYYDKSRRNDSNVVVPEYDFYVKDFVLLQLRADRHIVLYQRDEGFLLPLHSGLYIFLKDHAFHRLPVERLKADVAWKKEEEQVKQVVRNNNLPNNNYFVEHTDDNREVLTDDFGIRLLPGTYDRIERTRYFLLASRDQKTTACNIFLEPLAREDTVRAHNRQKHSYVYTGTDLACKELLPPVMDSISRFDNQGYLKLLICRDGLKGIYPVHTEPAYRYLGKPTSGFVRFQLKNGIKGWLNLQLKEELTDQD